MEHTENRTAFDQPFPELKGCVAQDSTASWAPISVPRSEDTSMFDFEVELC